MFSDKFCITTDNSTLHAKIYSKAFILSLTLQDLTIQNIYNLDIERRCI